MASTTPLKKFSKEPEKPERELSFKEQLDKAAIEAREPPEDKLGNGSLMKPIIEKGAAPRHPHSCRTPTNWLKVTEYIPSATKVLGDPNAKQDEEQVTKKGEGAPEGPPERPIHDHKIEEFVRDQHRSKGRDGKLV